MSKREGLLEAAAICDERAIRTNSVSTGLALCDAAQAIRARAAQEGDGWISVSERLPDENLRVLLFGEKGKAVGSKRLYTDGNPSYYWHVIYGERLSPNVVSHWMPLPAPPEQTNTAAHVNSTLASQDIAPDSAPAVPTDEE